MHTNESSSWAEEELQAVLELTVSSRKFIWSVLPVGVSVLSEKVN